MNKVKIKINSGGVLDEFTINDVPINGVTNLTFHKDMKSIPHLSFTIFTSEADIEVDEPELNCTQCQCLEDYFNNKEL